MSDKKERKKKKKKRKTSSHLLNIYFSGTDGGVYMTPGRISRRDEFTPVPSHGSTFVYMIPPQKVMPARVAPA